MKRTPNQKSSCSPVSSHCIDWEGGALESIEVCEGDSLNDIIQKLDTALKTVQDLLDLEDLDLKCLIETCAACPSPVKTLQNVLALSIGKHCSVAVGPSTPVQYEEKIVALAQCFLGGTDSEGDPVTKLPHSEYTKLLASRVCNLITTINAQGHSLDEILKRLTTIDGEILELKKPIKVSVPGITETNAPINIDDAVEGIADRLVELLKATGEPADLQQGANRQPTDLSKAPSLVGGTGVTLGSLPNWINPNSPISGTTAAAINNIWLSLMDVRGAVRAMLDTCCKVSCDSIVVDFDIRLSDDRQIATLFFGQKSKIPSGFRECNEFGTLITVMDSAGASFTKYVKVKQLISAPPSSNEDGSWGSVVIDLSTSPIDPNLDYTFSADPCITNGEMTCQKCISKVATYKDTCAFCTFSAVGKSSGEGIIIITYQDIDTGQKSVISLRAGQSQVLKRKIKIISVAKEGNLNLTTSCQNFQADLLNIEELSCYGIDYALDGRLNNAGGWDQEDVHFTGIGFLDQYYPTDILGVNTQEIVAFIKTTTPALTHVSMAEGGDLTTGLRNGKRILVKGPSSMVATAYATFKTVGFGPTRIFAVACTSTNQCCPPSTTSSAL